MSIYVSTVGTSLLRRFFRYSSGKYFRLEIDGEDGSREYQQNEVIEFLVERITESCYGQGEGKEKSGDALSAELSILQKQEICQRDCIYFLASDTEDGLTAAKALEEYYNRQTNCLLADTIIIDGIGFDFNSLKVEGFSNLIKQLCKIKNETTRDEDLVLVVSGGLKIITAFSVIMGNLFKCRMLLTHEKNRAILEVPYLPVAKDSDWICQIERKITTFLSLDYKTQKKEFAKLGYFEMTMVDECKEQKAFIMSDAGLYFFTKGIKGRSSYPIATSKAHWCLFGKNVSEVSDIKDEDIRHILKKIYDTCPNVIRMRLGKTEMHNKCESSCVEFVELHEDDNRISYLIYSNDLEGTVALDIYTDDGYAAEVAEKLGNRILP